MGFDDKIAEHKRAIEKLEKERAHFNSMDRAKQLAQIWHEKTCTLDHNDRCGWTWEGSNWSGHTHKHYLERAEKLLAKYGDELSNEDLLYIIRGGRV